MKKIEFDSETVKEKESKKPVVRRRIFKSNKDEDFEGILHED